MVLSLSSCQGLHGAQMAKTFGGPLPFGVLISTSDPVSHAQALFGFSTIYLHLALGHKLDEAVAAARAATSHDAFAAVGADSVRDQWMATAAAQAVRRTDPDTLARVARLFRPKGGFTGWRAPR